MAKVRGEGSRGNHGTPENLTHRAVLVRPSPEEEQRLEAVSRVVNEQYRKSVPPRVARLSELRRQWSQWRPTYVPLTPLAGVDGLHECYVDNDHVFLMPPAWEPDVRHWAKVALDAWAAHEDLLRAVAEPDQAREEVRVLAGLAVVVASSSNNPIFVQPCRSSAVRELAFRLNPVLPVDAILERLLWASRDDELRTDRFRAGFASFLAVVCVAAVEDTYARMRFTGCLPLSLSDPRAETPPPQEDGEASTTPAQRKVAQRRRERELKDLACCPRRRPLLRAAHSAFGDDEAVVVLAYGDTAADAAREQVGHDPVAMGDRLFVSLAPADAALRLARACGANKEAQAELKRKKGSDAAPRCVLVAKSGEQMKVLVFPLTK